MDGFKVDSGRFDFLSYDCVFCASGVEVVKQVLRVVRYGSSTPDRGPTEKLVEQVKQCAASVVPTHYKLHGIPNRTSILGPDYYLRGCTRDALALCPRPFDLIRARCSNGPYVYGPNEPVAS